MTITNPLIYFTYGHCFNNNAYNLFISQSFANAYKIGVARKCAKLSFMKSEDYEMFTVRAGHCHARSQCLYNARNTCYHCLGTTGGLYPFVRLTHLHGSDVQIHLCQGAMFQGFLFHPAQVSVVVT